MNLTARPGGAQRPAAPSHQSLASSDLVDAGPRAILTAVLATFALAVVAVARYELADVVLRPLVPASQARTFSGGAR